MMTKYLFQSFFILLTSAMPSFAQYSGPCDTNFGRNYISLSTSKNDSITLYSAPSKAEKPVARLYARFTQVRDNTYVPKPTLAWLGADSIENMSARMIDVYDVSEFALPVLSFSPDSGWAKVSLDCREQVDTPCAWLNVADARKAKLKVKSWASFFERDWTVVFLCEDMMGFYSAPYDTCQIFPTLSGDSSESDYWMKVIKTSGNWMLVSLQSPIPSDGVEPIDKFPEVWIKYLDDQGRPRVWYTQE